MTSPGTEVTEARVRDTAALEETAGEAVMGDGEAVARDGGGTVAEKGGAAIARPSAANAAKEAEERERGGGRE